jgi:glucosamine 6-phosphate synthetase-like amidotransferase/phosphosugar isomerase protein
MCGIHFTINAGSNCKNFDDFIGDAFLTNQVRGTDSSGLFSVGDIKPQNQLRDVQYFKKALNASDFVGYQPAQQLITAANKNLATVGHVRAATWGGNVDKNAHPFLTIRQDGSRIIGVHNGSLEGWQTKQDGDKFDVDSAWLYSKIAEDGIEAFEGFNGAFTLVWFDSLDQDTLFIALNGKRPLYWAWTEDKKGMIACSELGMLGWLADRRSIKLATVDQYRFHFPEPGFVHKINLKDPTKVEKVKFKDFTFAANKYVKVYEKPADRPVMPGPVVPAKLTHWRGGNVVDEVEGQLDAARQARVLSDMKTALGKARDKRIRQANLSAAGLNKEGVPFEQTENAEESHIVTGEMLERTLEREIAESLKRKGLKEDVDYGLTFSAQPNTKHALAPEVQRAKTIGLFGAIVEFCGYMYDDETGEVYGDFRIEENGVEEKYDAIVRGQSSQSAHIRYINPTKCSRMEVIGITDEGGGESPYVILSDYDGASEFETPPFSMTPSINRMLH